MSSIPQGFNQDELNDLTRDLNLSKEASELLASRLNDKIYWNMEPKLPFTVQEKRVCYPSSLKKKILVFCHEIKGFGLSECFLEDWRLFIGS
ncbi:hypothetical protein AVEN_102327-1 [Araneus ventricosus]|uniref:Uncharacterized protein n=1 Tax=Araneus ventricosus TaxID=182803 RepID=A0A4Y2DPF7_ARAVE|nr:hypothetical protein AVEN_166379-1 [Araneus ventricosus]GBM18720.1 hypothetical protein AVEN_102327-1 [Araneus ventricosus]